MFPCSPASLLSISLSFCLSLTSLLWSCFNVLTLVTQIHAKPLSHTLYVCIVQYGSSHSCLAVQCHDFYRLIPVQTLSVPRPDSRIRPVPYVCCSNRSHRTSSTRPRLSHSLLHHDCVDVCVFVCVCVYSCIRTLCMYTHAH